MKTRRGLYPTNIHEVNDETYQISLLDNFIIGLGLNFVSPNINEKFASSVFLIHQDTNIPLYTMSEISRFTGFIDSFSKDMMVYEKVYVECDLTYTYTQKEDIDYLNINFDYYRDKDPQEYDILGCKIKMPEQAPETLGNQVMTISLDRAQCYILAKEFPKALKQLHGLYINYIKKELSDYNYNIMQIGPDHY